MRGWRRLVRSLLSEGFLNRLMKLGTSVVPRIVAFIDGLRSKIRFLIAPLITGLLEIWKVKEGRKLVETLLGDNLHHKLVKIGTFAFPSVAALISDMRCQTCFLIPVSTAGFVAMMYMIYHNISRARESASRSR